MQHIELNRHSLDQISDAYNGLIKNIQLIDPEFKKSTVSRFRSKKDGIEKIAALSAIFLVKYTLFMNKLQYLNALPGVHKNTVPNSENSSHDKNHSSGNSSHDKNHSSGNFSKFNGYRGKKLPNNGTKKKERASKNKNRVTRKQEILAVITSRPATIADLSHTIGISKRNISTILSKLRNDGHLVKVTRLSSDNFLVEHCGFEK